MGSLKYFSIMSYPYTAIPKPEPPKPVIPEAKLVPFMERADTEITLAEYNPMSSDAITAHKLRDYRRRHFTLPLLPELSIGMDVFLKDDVDGNAPTL